MEIARTLLTGWKARLLLVLCLPICLGYLLPENAIIPVENASVRDWHRQSFWRYPWGKSGTHKGIDIFAPWGRGVLSATEGLVISTAERSAGGLTVTVLGPKWRLHYYAHLSKQQVKKYEWVGKGDLLGQVGTTGNAAGKEPHLHYSILRIFPNPFAAEGGKPEGWKKMFYLNPDKVLRHVD